MAKDILTVDCGDSAGSSAVARHVSPEGCQLVLAHQGGEGGMPARGQRLALSLEGFVPVHATVRWIVGDRAGVAFDTPLMLGALKALRKTVHGGQAIAISGARN